MKDTKADDKLLSLKKALDRLDTLLALPENHEGRVEAVIQSFEFVFELGWKTAKIILEYREGVQAGTPRQAFQQLYVANYINDEQAWINMLSARNLTSHTYQESIAQKVMADIPLYRDMIRELYDILSKKGKIQ